MMRDYVRHPSERLREIFTPNRPLLSGPVQNQDSYMKGRVAQRFFYDRVKPAVKAAMEEFGILTGRRHRMLRCHRMEDAEYAIVGMGTMMETAEATVDYLRRKGMRIGAVSVISFRPFPAAELADALRDCTAVTVIERTDNPLAASNPLTLEVKAALADDLASVPEVYSGVAGLGGAEVRPGHFVAAARNMVKEGPTRFVLGVKHEDALEITEDPDVRPQGAYSVRGHSVGGFGSVTTNKVIATVAAELFGLDVQAFSKYGSEKKGLPTAYYLTLESNWRSRMRRSASAVLVRGSIVTGFES